MRNTSIRETDSFLSFKKKHGKDVFTINSSLHSRYVFHENLPASMRLRAAVIKDIGTEIARETKSLQKRVVGWFWL
jgi:hypothetical protein